MANLSTHQQLLPGLVLSHIKLFLVLPIWTIKDCWIQMVNFIANHKTLTCLRVDCWIFQPVNGCFGPPLLVKIQSLHFFTCFYFLPQFEQKSNKNKKTKLNTTIGIIKIGLSHTRLLPQKWTACIVTSRWSHFAGGLSNK